MIDLDKSAQLTKISYGFVGIFSARPKSPTTAE